MIKPTFITLFVVALFTQCAFALPMSEAHMRETIMRYFTVMDALKDKSDIKTLVAMVDDTFIYQHRAQSTHLDKLSWQQALKYKLNNRDLIRYERTQVQSIQFARDAAFVVQTVSWQQKEGQAWYAHQQVITTLFEFQQGKIIAIREYW